MTFLAITLIVHAPPRLDLITGKGNGK